MKQRAVYAAIAVLLGLALGLWAWRYYSDEAVIRRMFAATARAVEEERLVAVAQHFSRAYTDPYGQSYESLLGFVSDLFTTYDGLSVSLSVDSVSLSGKTASVAISFRLSGSTADGSGLLLGERLTPATATVLVRDRNGEWIVERVEEANVPNVPNAAERRSP